MAYPITLAPSKSGKWPTSYSETCLFGAKPEIVLKSGMIVHAVMGDPNASIATPQPYMYRPMFGSYGGAQAALSATFVSQSSLQLGTLDSLGLRKQLLPVRNCRTVRKADLVHNGETPEIMVDPMTYAVTVNGEKLTSAPSSHLPLSQRYFLV